MPRPPRVARIAEVASVVTGGVRVHAIRRELGIAAFGVNAFSAAAGEDLIEPHDETSGGGAGGHEELYVVLTGRARFGVDGQEIDAPAGTAIFVGDPLARRHAVAEEDGTTVLVVGGRVGEAFGPSPWEGGALAAAFAEQGDLERTRRYRDEALAEHPDHPQTLYNVACAEVALGEHDAALEHLTRAVELEPGAREWAVEDAQLDPIRDDARFPGP
jgi:tetratricopeptide (TPR) repeat protein